MDFVDQTIVRLADTAQRAALFDQTALAQIATAAYDSGVMGVTGPYEPLFDEVQLGVGTAALGSLQGSWRPVGSSEYTEAQFQLGGVTPPDDGRIDALWRGAITAQFAQLGEPISTVKVTWLQLGRIDTEIIAAQGSLPADPALLEQARRDQLLSDLRADLAEPNALTDTGFDRWLAGLGAGSVSELVEQLVGGAAGATLQVTFAPPAPVSATPQPLPLAAAMLIRDATGFSLATLLSESKQARARIEALGLALSADHRTRPRHRVVVIWIVPTSLFSDSDWPGATAGETPDQQIAARRAAAGAWLAEEGIGLVAA
jgi:hypothetical protein